MEGTKEVNQQRTDEHKKVIASFDAKIAQLNERAVSLQEAKESFCLAVVNFTLDEARSQTECHIGCCGPQRKLTLSSAACAVSPIGTCVYEQEAEKCLFCHEQATKVW